MLLNRATTPVRITPLAWFIMRLYKQKWSASIVFSDGMVTLLMYDVFYHKFLQQRLPGEIISDTIIRKLLPTGDEVKRQGKAWAIVLSLMAFVVVIATLFY